MSIEDENEISDIASRIINAARDDDRRVIIIASLKLLHSRGYRQGYKDAMKDASLGKDRRVVAHLN